MKVSECRILHVVVLLLLGTALSAQNISVTGTVMDSSGEPLAGANVMVKDNNNLHGVSTDIDGRFELEVPENSFLEISFIGFITQTVKVTGRQDLRIVLAEDANLMDEVVVVGFGTQKKESVVGAITAIKSEELQVPVRSLSNSLGGRVAGIISVQSSGEPGKDDAQFWIRGISTFTGNRNPLVLVDGIERPMNNVDPLEIESFSVLKDASATAVYGVRGANGVILITTKRGFDGPAKVDARYEHGFSQKTVLPECL